MTVINSNSELKVSTVTEQIISEVSKVVVGKNQVLAEMICAFLSGGHVLLEDYPGLAKTLIANSFAAVLGMSFEPRPSDVTLSLKTPRSEKSSWSWLT